MRQPALSCWIMLVAATLGLSSALLTSAYAQSSVEQTDKPADDGYRAVTRARHDLHMGFTVSGLAGVVHVEPGDRVKKGQMLVELRHDESDALVALWDKRRKSTTQLKAAQARRELAALEEKRLRELLARDGASPIEHTRAKLQLDLEELNVARADEERDEAEQQYKQAVATRDRYLLRAPRDGVIERVTVDVGELVETVQPILQMVDATQLHMDVMVPTDEAFDRALGDQAVVRALDNPNLPEMHGKVVEIANVADGSSASRRIVVQVENPGGLPAGMHVVVSFTKPKNDSATDAESTARAE